MLLVAAALTIAVGLMHSILGGKRLIQPILAMDGLPIILGSANNTRLTLAVGWHMLTFTWWGMAAIMIHLHYTSEGVGTAFLSMIAILFGLSGLIALIASRGRHRSWIFFLPISAIAAYSALPA
ncbi:MAG: hypothetical protein AAGE05_07325 [Pseudomonadota bacterium]